MMKWLNILPIALVSFSSIGIAGIAQARVIDEIGNGRPVFKNAGAIMPANAESACVRDVIKYETRYGDRILKQYSGQFRRLLPRRSIAFQS
jgi:hypothetical protein